MKVIVTPYQHFKGGHYLVFGDILPLPSDFQHAHFSFTAKESEQAESVDIFVTKEGIYYHPFTKGPMTLYLSEQTNEWWIRPSNEFHGDKENESGQRVKRFTPRDNVSTQTVAIALTESI